MNTKVIATVLLVLVALLSVSMVSAIDANNTDDTMQVNNYLNEEDADYPENVEILESNDTTDYPVFEEIDSPIPVIQVIAPFSVTKVVKNNVKDFINNDFVQKSPIKGSFGWGVSDIVKGSFGWGVSDIVKGSFGWGVSDILKSKH